MGQADPAVQQLIDAHPFLKLREDGRVECTLNSHTMPARADAIKSFIQGKKLQKLIGKYNVTKALEHYEPFLTPSINFPGKLFCALTNHLIVADLDAVKMHLKGKRFLRAKDQFQADKLELFEEPDLAEGESDAEEEAGDSEQGKDGKTTSESGSGTDSGYSSGLPSDMDVVLGRASDDEDEVSSTAHVPEARVEDQTVLAAGEAQRKRRAAPIAQNKPQKKKHA